MAEGDGEGIGDVVGLGETIQTELGLDGALDLAFGGVAGAGEGFFYSGGGVGGDGDAGLGGGEVDRAAGVGHEDGGAGVLVDAIKLLDGDDGGVETFQDFGEAGVDFEDALAEGELG